MLCHETPAFSGVVEIHNCRLTKPSWTKPTSATCPPVDSHASLSSNGCNHHRFSSRLWKSMKVKPKVNGYAFSWVSLLLLNENLDVPPRKVDSVASPTVVEVVSEPHTDVNDKRGLYAPLDDVNKGKIRMLIDNEVGDVQGSGITLFGSGSWQVERFSRASVPLVSVIKEELPSSLRATPTKCENEANTLTAKVHSDNRKLSNCIEGGTSSSVELTQRIVKQFMADSSCSPDESLVDIVSALESADTWEKINSILSPTLHLSSSDLNNILNSLKRPEKVTELLLWMNDNCLTTANFDICINVFKVLGRRQEWAVMDSLLRDLVPPFQDEAACEMFNTLLDACLTAGSHDWATKWFQLMLDMGICPNDSTYTTLMSLYRRHVKLEEAEFVYQHMVKNGGKCLQAYWAMMNLYTPAGQFEKVDQVLHTMMKNNIKPEKRRWLMQLDGYVKHGKVNEAEKVMLRMQECGIAPDIFAYNSMITVNGKANHFRSAIRWFHRLEKDGLQPDAVTYRSLIGACGRTGNLKEALEFYDRMRHSGFRPSIHNFNSLIHLHRKIDDDNRVLCLLSDMREMKYCPDSSTLDAVVKVYERHGQLENIPRAFKLLQEAGWSPDEKCFTILIEAYIRCSLVDQALDAFSHLCTGSKLCKSWCHNLICMCKTAGRYEEALHVFHEMQRSHTRPRLKTSCTIIDIYGLKGAVDKGEALFKELHSSGQELDSVAYNVTINMYLKAGLFQKAAEVLELVNEHEGLEPDSYLFLSMLRVYAKCGLHLKGVAVYRRMVKAKLTWNEALYSAVIHCCGRLLPLEEITKVFQAMIYAKFPINNVTCNVMIDIFGKAGLLEKAENVLTMAQKQGVLDCISYNTFIDACGKYKDFSKMESALIDMQNEGFYGSVEAYNCMLDAYGKSGQISKMENILERMRRAGCNANIATFNILINIFGKEGLIVELEGVLKKMAEVDIKPNCYTYNTLIHAYGNAEMPDEAVRSFREMQDAGFMPNRITYTCLISAFEKSGNHLEAARWSLWMVQAGMSI